MSDLVILGTDTDAGKTTFALLWMTAFADRFEYWKPVETGPSDSELVKRLCPQAVVHPPLIHLDEPVAPPLAARRAQVAIPSAEFIAARRPTPTQPGRALLIETFGSPFSPLNEQEDQTVLLHALRSPMILVTSSSLGAIGRTKSCLVALGGHDLSPAAVVLLGPADEFALEQLGKQTAAVALPRPETFTVLDLQREVAQQKTTLDLPLFFSPPRLPPRIASELLQEHDRTAIWHPYTALQTLDPPLACVGAQDEFLRLADSRRVIDGISSWWTILHGHRTPHLVDALHRTLQEIDHVHFAGVTHPWAVQLAELLLATMPWRGGRVFYSDNGSTAVEVALKMAYQFWCHGGEPQRQSFVGFEHGYHGDTFGAMSVSRDPLFFGRFEPLLFRADVLALDPNRLDEFLTRRGKEIAAVILEPLVQGAGAMRMHTPETLRQIFEITRRHDVLFIADEVMTGGGRTGSLWAFQAANIAPDLVCAAKTLAGGMMPLAATLASPRIVEAFDTSDRTRTFFHGHSFTAHPLACAVAVANWQRLTAEPPAAPWRMEAFWTEALTKLQNHRMVADVRIRGSIAAVELNVPGGYLADVGRHLSKSCLDKNVLLRPLGNVLYAMPPYCTPDESLRQIADAMIYAIRSLG
jgi:adenosylmethionine-8-amino-7-oxononanoate aminotransferase